MFERAKVVSLDLYTSIASLYDSYNREGVYSLDGLMAIKADPMRFLNPDMLAGHHLPQLIFFTTMHPKFWRKTNQDKLYISDLEKRMLWDCPLAYEWHGRDQVVFQTEPQVPQPEGPPTAPPPAENPPPPPGTPI